ncbi:MAG: DNA translocase FtsK [bacterium]
MPEKPIDVSEAATSPSEIIPIHINDSYNVTTPEVNSISPQKISADHHMESPKSPFTRTLEYEYPDIMMLKNQPEAGEKETYDELVAKSEKLLRKLNEFSIDGRITEICPGPIITRYEFEPAPGIKISKVITLSDDLALGMRSRFGLRVVPIPGKSALGIEIPNQSRELVNLKEILLSEEFQIEKTKSLLSLPLGRDTAGKPYISDLKRMPHLLIAGATGSGKSVCINTILAGLLFITRPSELRFLLIDPKMLELSDFNGIPHLREPVITDPKITPDALNWAVSEMERRYRLLADEKVRNIDQFNARVTSPQYEGENESLPYLVIVIDELADLMLTAASTIEDAIQRLAQMARAAGIHLIIATQRPSVDVITGVIKANLPCRLAFQVASKVDSRTILDTVGAEKLIGLGDCIFMPPGTSQLLRLHGAYISESEIKRLVEHLKQQPSDELDEESIFKSVESAEDDLEGTDDPLYNDAVRLVLSSGVASISMLQRRLRIGHSRASRLIDFMELSGIVGPHIGSKTRDILVDPDEYLGRLDDIEESGINDQI